MSQKKFIINQLETNKEISRNFCLQSYISRLGAVICDLKKEGWNFKTETRKGDFIYIVTNSPDSQITPLNAPVSDLKPTNEPKEQPSMFSTGEPKTFNSLNYS